MEFIGYCIGYIFGFCLFILLPLTLFGWLLTSTAKSCVSIKKDIDKIKDNKNKR